MIQLKNININDPIKLTGDIILPDNSITLIQGKNGSGKSLLFYQITLLGKLKCEYILDNNRVKNNDIQLSKNRKNYISIVLQNDDLRVEMTVKDYIQTFCRVNKVSTSDVKSYMHTFGLDLYDDFLITKLSGGQKSRLSICLAFSKKSKLFVLDEPTSALDDENTLILKKQLLEKKKNHIICIMTHDKRLLDLANQTYVIKDGRIGLDV